MTPDSNVVNFVWEFAVDTKRRAAAAAGRNPRIILGWRRCRLKVKLVDEKRVRRHLANER